MAVFEKNSTCNRDRVRHMSNGKKTRPPRVAIHPPEIKIVGLLIRKRVTKRSNTGPRKEIGISSSWAAGNSSNAHKILMRS